MMLSCLFCFKITTSVSRCYTQGNLSIVCFPNGKPYCYLWQSEMQKVFFWRLQS